MRKSGEGVYGGGRREAFKPARRAAFDGGALRGRRLAAGLSVVDLARLTGLPRATVYDCENGQRSNPGFRTALKLARALGCRMDDFASRAGAASP